MSFLLSLPTLFSLISFLTTFLALVRVGSAAFLSNQLQNQLVFAHRYGVMGSGATGAVGVDVGGGVVLGLSRMGGGQKVEKTGAGGAGVLGRVRVPPSIGVGYPVKGRSGMRSAPSSPLFDPQRPLSMAKMIMSRHLQRKPNRIPPLRRPPGLLPNRSRLVEEVV